VVIPKRIGAALISLLAAGTRVNEGVGVDAFKRWRLA
jgi:hypothetical protein